MRRSEKQPGGEALAINFEHQPPCLGATISTSSFGASGVSPRLVRSDEASVDRGRHFRLGEAERGAQLGECTVRRWRRAHH